MSATVCGRCGRATRRLGLHDTLGDWTDWDMAAFCLGRTLGLYERPSEWWDGTVWSDTQLGSTLHAMLLGLAAAGVLEQRDHPDQQFRFACSS